jgi:hypothetical protein
MLRSKLTYAAVTLALVVATGAYAQDAYRVRNAFSGASVCADSPVLSRWCADLGVQAAYWIDKGVSFAIDRHFEQKDQRLANKTGIAICYNDGHCIRPQ